MLFAVYYEHHMKYYPTYRYIENSGTDSFWEHGPFLYAKIHSPNTGWKEDFFVKSKKAIAFEKFKFSDLCWNAEVVPVAGSTDVAICATTLDRYTGRKRYGQTLAIYAHRATAEKVCKELNTYQARRTVRALF